MVAIDIDDMRYHGIVVDSRMCLQTNIHKPKQIDAVVAAKDLPVDESTCVMGRINKRTFSKGGHALICSEECLISPWFLISFSFLKISFLSGSTGTIAHFPSSNIVCQFWDTAHKMNK